MDTSQIAELIVIIVLVIFSSFFSASETAFSMSSIIKLKSMGDEGNRGALTAIKILDNPNKMLSTILVGNNIVNIASSSIATTLFMAILGSSGAGVATIILTVVLLIFGEITPKTLAAANPEKFACAVAPVIRIFTIVLTPVVFIINVMAGFFVKLFSRGKNNSKSTMTESELRALLDVSSEEGVIETNEKNIINNLIDFGDSIAKDIMTPRANIVSVDINSTFDEVVETYRTYKHSRVPVYKDNPNNIVGILHSKDILMVNPERDEAFNNNFSVSDIMRDAYYTYEMQNNSTLFKDMQKERTSIAIVIDEYGEVSGIITTQDLLEEIIGKIHDEYDEKSKDSCIQVSPNIYKAEGSLKLDDLNDFIGSDLSSEENDSVAGLVIEKLDRFPVAGDSVTVNDVYITVIKTDRNRVETVLVKKIKNNDSTDNNKESEK